MTTDDSRDSSWCVAFSEVGRDKGQDPTALL